ncbi:hypothetical protein SEA_ALTADENA_57 [Arthrobacter phage Altadena]|uniref:Uncharacterized protein n=1 Tax=Arthrobacter phage Altadena TaxID=3059064 RepID=A0AA96HVK2_9CAUD|nr:hypothetical protein SEA_ALTADENA_57 [Arthrobacter phage Altadena]
MRAPKYAAYQLDGVHGGKLLEWHEQSETYRAIADFPQAVRASLVADELNAAEARREADERAREAAEAEAQGAPSEPRETQLDALVIPGDTERHPELHADRRPDSYGHFEEFRGREHKLAPRIGFLPPDGTVPGR